MTDRQKPPRDASSREIKEELKPRKMSIAEIEALINKEDNRKIQITEDGMVLVGPARDLDTQDAEIDRLKAQNEKMREALEKIATCDCEANENTELTHYCDGKKARIAEEALKGE